MPLRCLLVDDNDAFLEAARVLLEREGMQVAGMASNIAGALRQARALRPDVILVDIGLGEESGFELARLLAADGQDGQRVQRGQGIQRGRADVILISAQAETRLYRHDRRESGRRIPAQVRAISPADQPDPQPPVTAASPGSS